MKVKQKKQIKTLEEPWRQLVNYNTKTSGKKNYIRNRRNNKKGKKLEDQKSARNNVETLYKSLEKVIKFIMIILELKKLNLKLNPKQSMDEIISPK